MSTLFLTDEEVATLTGIKTGRSGKRREELQAEFLSARGLLFTVNARGLPIVTRSSIIDSTNRVAQLMAQGGADPEAICSTTWASKTPPRSQRPARARKEA